MKIIYYVIIILSCNYNHKYTKNFSRNKTLIYVLYRSRVYPLYLLTTIERSETSHEISDVLEFRSLLSRMLQWIFVRKFEHARALRRVEVERIKLEHTACCESVVGLTRRWDRGLRRWLWAQILEVYDLQANVIHFALY